MEYDLLTIEEKSSTVIIEASQVSASKKSNMQRHGIRRFENEKIYQASRLGATHLERLIQDTKEWGGPGTNHDYGFAPARIENRNEAPADEKGLELYKEGLHFLNEKYSDFIFSGRCVTQNVKKTLKSSYGLSLSTAAGLYDWYYMYQRKGSGNMIDGFIGEVSSKIDIQNSIDENSEFFDAQGKIVKIKSGRMPVLLMDEKAPLKKLMESFYINKYSEGSALYSGKLNENIFDKKVTLLDCNYDPSVGKISFFDGEGVVRNNELVLVDQGRFVSTISDMRFAKKFNGVTTGNGLRPYNKGVGLDFNSLRFKKNKNSWRSIVKNLDQCLLVLVAVGGDSNDLGEFSTPVQIGYIMQRGVIVGQAPQLTIKTSIDNYLGKDLIDISSDGFTRNSPSACVVSEMDILLN